MIELNHFSEAILSFLIMHSGNDTLIADGEQDESIRFLLRNGLIERSTCEGLEVDCYALSQEGKKLSAAISEAGITISANQ